MAKDAYIKVYAWEGKAGVEYRLESKHKNPNHGGGEALAFFSPDGSDWTMVFTIEENTLGLTFKRIAKDAFWVSKTTCPHAPSHDSQFIPKNVTHAQKRLIVTNKNKVVSDYHFALNFDSDIGPLQYDPIIENKNGGNEIPDGINLVGGIVTALLLAVGLGFLLNRSRKNDRGDRF